MAERNTRRQGATVIPRPARWRQTAAENAWDQVHDDVAQSLAGYIAAQRRLGFGWREVAEMVSARLSRWRVGRAQVGYGPGYASLRRWYGPLDQEAPMIDVISPVEVGPVVVQEGEA